jgi:hypothetical protein
VVLPPLKQENEDFRIRLEGMVIGKILLPEPLVEVIPGAEDGSTGDRVTIGVRGVTGSVSDFNWLFLKKGFIEVDSDGTAVATIKGMALQLTVCSSPLNPPTQEASSGEAAAGGVVVDESPESYLQHPLSVQDIKVEVGSIDIDVSGSKVSHLINGAFKIFDDEIREAICEALEEQVKRYVEWYVPTINWMLRLSGDV